MDIKKAKEQIKNTVSAYLEKNEYGNYIISQYKQRPIFLMGPPGIGKTEIMSQVASELNIGLLSYSMTHHTRQSALGLPIIRDVEYFGEKYSVSQYSMSEIIGSIYTLMNKSGMDKGILFIDEINCVSETLTPIMLQFLQYKMLGSHKVPEGWIICTAGNPQEYNSSVRDFDMATWDRLKRIDIEPSFDAWKEYAYNYGVHPSVVTFLEIYKQKLYVVETTVDGKSFVTARGWDDLSNIIKVYEKKGIKVDADLVCQYIQNKKIAKDFAIYYDLFNKYKSDYQVEDIFNGNVKTEIVNRAKAAKFDERFALIGLLADNIISKATDINNAHSAYQVLRRELQKLKKYTDSTIVSKLDEIEVTKKVEYNRLKSANSLSSDKNIEYQILSKTLYKLKEAIAGCDSKLFDGIRKAFNTIITDHEKASEKVKKGIDNTFDFINEYMNSGQEMLLFVTEITASRQASKFIATFGSEKYSIHSKALLFYERQLQIIDEINTLDLDISDDDILDVKDLPNNIVA